MPSLKPAENWHSQTGCHDDSCGLVQLVQLLEGGVYVCALYSVNNKYCKGCHIIFQFDKHIKFHLILVVCYSFRCPLLKKEKVSLILPQMSQPTATPLPIINVTQTQVGREQVERYLGQMKHF